MKSNLRFELIFLPLLILVIFFCNLAVSKESKPISNRRLFINLSAKNYKERNIAIEGIAQLGKDSIPQLLRLLEKSNDKNNKLSILSVLKKLKKKAHVAIPEVLIFFADKDPELRFSAIDTIISMAPDKRCVHPLLAALLDNDVRVNYIAATALGMIKSDMQEAVTPLLNSLKNGNAQAAWAISRIGLKSEKIYSSLSLALNDDNYRVREEAVKALGILFGEKSVEALKCKLIDNNVSVRSTAQRTILRINKKYKKAIIKLNNQTGKNNNPSNDSNLFIKTPMPFLKK